jgi:hypothetical protein
MQVKFNSVPKFLSFIMTGAASPFCGIPVFKLGTFLFYTEKQFSHVASV